MRADWPCSSAEFGVSVLGASSAPQVPVVWHGPRVRLNATVVRAGTSGATQVLSHTVLVGQSGLNPWAPSRAVGWVPLPSAAGNYTVRLTKLSTSAPFGTGVGGDLVGGSTVTLFGLGAPQPAGAVGYGRHAPRQASRRIEAVGASDTAGWCVDGNTTTNPFLWALNGWSYSNCGQGYVHHLGDRFGAQVSVQAISGIGVWQNSNAKQRWQMGPLAMPGYWNRTLQMNATAGLWDFAAHPAPDVVLVSLGGNDYNHQNGSVPSNATFTAAMGAFTQTIFDDYDARRRSPGRPGSAGANGTVVVAVCGMGDPTEVVRSPDNNRCRPCPHVADAVAAFKADPARAHLAPRLHYVYVPCDGSVVTGHGDIGCDGHKNAAGQAKVAHFLGPRIAAIMGWQ